MVQREQVIKELISCGCNLIFILIEVGNHWNALNGWVAYLISIEEGSHWLLCIGSKVKGRVWWDDKKQDGVYQDFHHGKW